MDRPEDSFITPSGPLLDNGFIHTEHGGLGSNTLTRWTWMMMDVPPFSLWHLIGFSLDPGTYMDTGWCLQDTSTSKPQPATDPARATETAHTAIGNLSSNHELVIDSSFSFIICPRKLPWL